MKLSRLVAPATLTTALVFAGASVAAPTTSIFDANGTLQVKPAEIFLTADAGPYVRRIHWSGWGTAKAIGHGQYVSTCASCLPPKHRAATITLTGLAKCAVSDGMAYRHGTLRTGADRTGKPTTFALPTGFAFCSMKPQNP